MPAIVLPDTSGSMGATDIPGTSRRRIDQVVTVLDEVLRAAPDTRVIPFNSTVKELYGLEPGRGLKLPEPMGGTMLDEALRYVAAHPPKPSRLIVISDGMPSCEPADCFRAARALAPLIIDAIYVGPDGPEGRAPLQFMRTLSLMGGKRGISGLRSLANPQALANEIRGLLR
jgi:hypothetical protein